jgi:hypothetical protein
MSDTKPNIDNLPLDLFGDQPAPATEPVDAATAANLGPLAQSSAQAGPFTAAPADAAIAIPRRLRRLYDAVGILAITAVIGLFFGAFTWRIVIVLLIGAGGYIWLLKQARPRYYARMEQYRERIERQDA